MEKFSLGHLIVWTIVFWALAYVVMQEVSVALATGAMGQILALICAFNPTFAWNVVFPVVMTFVIILAGIYISMLVKAGS
jgi:multisubunit Na+/H+ antiporter MnhG subunit